MISKEFIKPEFIPVFTEALHDENLQTLDSLVLGAVYWYQKLKDGICTASNNTIARVIGSSNGNSVSNSLSRLEKNGYIKLYFKDENKDERTRIECLMGISKKKRVTSTDGGLHLQMEGVTSTDGGGDPSVDGQKKNTIEKNINNTIASQKNEKPSIEDYKELAGKIYQEVRDGDDVADRWCHPNGKPLSPAENKKLEDQYRKTYAQATTGLDELLSKRKVVNRVAGGTVKDVFQLFEYINPDYDTWYKIPAMRESAGILLEKTTLEAMSETLAYVQKNKNKKYCPKILTPYALLHKVADLDYFRNSQEAEEKGKMINPFRTHNE